MSKPRPRARPRREEILDAAHVVLTREGVYGTTALKVAEEVPISEPSIFYHFGSRDGLLLELAMRLFIEELDAVREAAEAADDAKSAMRALARCRWHHYEGRLEDLELVHVWAFPRYDDEQRSRSTSMVSGVFDIVEAKGSPPPRRIRIGMLWVLTEGMLQHAYRLARGTLRSKFGEAETLAEIEAIIEGALAG